MDTVADGWYGFWATAVIVLRVFGSGWKPMESALSSLIAGMNRNGGRACQPLTKIVIACAT